jgi:uncharacterized LabA/DUF88 family protein
MRARIFIDFWNLQLSIYEHMGREYRLDWLKLSPCLINEAETILGESLRFDGTNVYISYNPKSDADRPLRGWAINVLDRFSGVNVTLKEREPKLPPVCPDCHTLVEDCPHCHKKMHFTSEKGIDTAIATDMISLAWEDAWDVALLVSSDKDYIPVVEFLGSKGKRVLNACFPPKGMHLARTCWASINLIPHLPDLAR